MPAILDASGGVVSWVDSPEPDIWRFGSYQDCEPIIEHNKKLQTADHNRQSFLRRKASIPLNLIQQWLMEDGIDARQFWQWKWREQQVYLRRKYQDTDYRHLRTA